MLDIFNVRTLLNATLTTLLVNAMELRAPRFTFYDEQKHLEARFPAEYECWRTSENRSMVFKEALATTCRGDGQIQQRVAVEAIQNCDKHYDASCSVAISEGRCNYLEMSKKEGLYFVEPHCLASGKQGISPCFFMSDPSEFSNEQAICLDFNVRASRAGDPFYELVAPNEPFLVTRKQDNSDYIVVSHANAQGMSEEYDCVNGRSEGEITLSQAEFGGAECGTNCEQFRSVSKSLLDQVSDITQSSALQFDFCDKAGSERCGLRDPEHFRVYIPNHSMYSNTQQESDSGKKKLLVVGLRTSRGEFERNYEAFKEPVWILAYVLYFAFFLVILIIAFFLVLYFMRVLLGRVTRPIKRVVESMEGILKGRKMTLEPKYFTAACTEIRELLNFLDELLIAKRIIVRDGRVVLWHT